MTAIRYRTKPVEIEAMEWDGTEHGGAAIAKWTNHAASLVFTQRGTIENLMIETLEGDMLASKGDFIIRGLRGEFYPRKPDVFHRKYEPVS